MNGYAHESHFGPPSELIDVARFILSAFTSSSSVLSTVSDSWKEVSEVQRDVIANECSVSDIKDSLLAVWNDPELAACLTRNHAITLGGIHDSADASNRRKRKAPKFVDPSKQSPKAIALQNELDSVQLRSWPFTLQSALFLRTPKNSDHNALKQVKPSVHSSPILSSTSQEAVITVTVHDPVSWGHGYLSRASQHVILSSQTLGDLLDIVPCSSKEPGTEVIQEGQVVGYENIGQSIDGSAGVLCIEGTAYSDGGQDDYAKKLISHMEKMPSEKRHSIEVASTTLHETSFASLSIRLNEPYWWLHRGNCQHFIVFDQIRLQHPSDPPSGYPLTIQITPTLLDLCRACGKVPAVWAITGDMRLGESPCLMCSVCWKVMGEPNEDEKVVAVPLPTHKRNVEGMSTFTNPFRSTANSTQFIHVQSY